MNANNHLSDCNEKSCKSCKDTETPTGVKVKAKKTKAVVSWKKSANAASYQVQYSLTKNFKKSTTKTTKKTTLTVSGLKSGKKYFVRVKAVGSGKTASKWSAVKNVKVK